MAWEMVMLLSDEDVHLVSSMPAQTAHDCLPFEAYLRHTSQGRKVNEEILTCYRLCVPSGTFRRVVHDNKSLHTFVIYP